MWYFGADTGGPLTRLATLQPPPYEDDCKPGYQPCRLRFDWVGLAPTGRLIRVLVYIQTSTPTGIAWSLLFATHRERRGRARLQPTGKRRRLLAVPTISPYLAPP